MVDVRGDVLRPSLGTTPAAVKSNIKSEMRSFKGNENIHKEVGGSYYVVSSARQKRTLIIGDSILKGVNSRGLKKGVKTCTRSGATIN